MKKNAKKLLSLITAGLFVLQSIPFMAVGASAAGELEARKYTPTLDGVKDEAYEYSYSHKLETSFGGVEVGFLYDDSYIYVLADVASSLKGSECFSLAMSATDDPVSNLWTVIGTSMCYVVSNPFLEGYEIRHWEAPIGGSGWKNLGYNLGWQGGADPTGNASNTDTTAGGFTSLPDEFELVETTEGAVLEFRIAYNNDNIPEGDTATNRIEQGQKVTFSIVENLGACDYLYAADAVGNVADNHTFTLGSELKIADPTVVKKGTPVIDGALDGLWYDTAKVETLALAKNGEASLGWSYSDADIKKLVEAGLLDDASDTTINADGDFSSPSFTYADVYFLWDDSNLYIFSKVYDNDIVLLADETDIADMAEIVWDNPWINENIGHTIVHNSNSFTAVAYAGNICYDSANCVGWHDGMVLGECDTATPKNTLLHCYAHTTADVHYADRDEYMAVEVHADEGYYNIELCVPLTESFASTFLQNGAEFKYGYEINDAYKPGLSTAPIFDGYQAKNWMRYTNSTNTYQTLSISDTEAEAPACVHVWNTEPTVIKAATCEAEGSQNYRCSSCGEVKPNSIEVIPALGHNYVDGVCTNCGEKQPKIVYKHTPTLDGVMDSQYLGSAALTFEELVADSNFQVTNWHTDNNVVGKLADAGLIQLETDADGNYVKKDGYYNIIDGLITAEDDITNEFLTKTDSYFLWDDEAIYIYSKVYDNDPLNIDIAFEESGSNLYEGIGVDQPWLSDLLVHSINPENNIYATMNISGLAYGNAIWDDSWNSEVGGWSTLSDFRYAPANLRRIEAEENLAVTVNEEEGWYALEMRIPISERDFNGTPLVDSFLQDGKQFTYNYTVSDGFKKMLDPKASFSGYHAANWTRSSTIAGTVFQLAEASPEAPHVHEYDATVVVTEATCTTDGAGTQTCAGCGKVNDVVIPALGHDIVVDAAVAATCTEDGLTEGSHCSRCADATVAQETVPATGHIDENADNICDACGETLSVPGDINADGVIDVKDLTRLMKLIAGEDVEATNPDVNGDEVVDVKDLTRLMKAIAGEEVELH